MQEEEEADPETRDDPDTSVWPSKGAVEVQKVVMRYRPNLPAVLRSVTFSVRPFPSLSLFMCIHAHMYRMGRVL